MKTSGWPPRSRRTSTVEAGRGTRMRAWDGTLVISGFAAGAEIGCRRTIVVDVARRPRPGFEWKDRGAAPGFRRGPAVEAENVGIQARRHGDPGARGTDRI